jgi:hypothetical protein
MRVLWFFIRGLLKAGVIAGLFLAALVLALWGLERSGLITFRSGYRRPPSASPAKNSGTAPQASLGQDAATDPSVTDGIPSDHGAKKAMRHLRERAQVVQDQAQLGYAQLRGRIAAVVSPGLTPEPLVDASQPEQTESVANGSAEEDAAPIPQVVPEYQSLKNRLDGLATDRAAAPGGAAPSTRVPAEPIKPVDAPQYEDLKQRLQDILSRER